MNPNGITDFERKLAENIERRKRLTRQRMERQDQARKLPVKLVLTTSAEKRDRADTACMKLHEMPLLAWWTIQLDTLAESPEGHIPPKNRRRLSYSLVGADNVEFGKELTLRIEQYEPDFSNGFTMTDIYELWNDEPGVFDRRAATIVGYIMKNLGYRKMRVRVPATDDAPAKLGWIYRKEEPWQPSGS